MGQCTSNTVEATSSYNDVDRKRGDCATPKLEKVSGSESSSVEDATSRSSDSSNQSITSNEIIYLDNNATTPIDPRVFDAMKPFLTREFGNPSAKGYRHGWDAQRVVDAARRQVASLIGCAPAEVVFTSGATESDAMALLGTFEALDKRRGAHLVTSLMEHSAVLEAAKKLEKTYDDVDVTYLGVPAEDEGVTTASSVEAALRDDTKMVSIMMVNNEIGVINEIEAIGKLCTERGVLFHVDACQGLGKVPLDVKRFGIDMLSASSHKIYGPKGCGAFFIAERAKQFFSPLLRGGGQEFGLRGGTHNVPGIVGFGEACQIAKRELENTNECARLRKLRDTLYHTLKDGVKEIVVNGSLEPSRRVPSNLNVSFPGVDGEALLNKVNTKIALSSGSACTGATGSISHVMTTLGVPDELARSTLRFGLGRFTTTSDVERAGKVVVDVVRELYDKDLAAVTKTHVTSSQKTGLPRNPLSSSTLKRAPSSRASLQRDMTSQRRSSFLDGIGAEDKSTTFGLEVVAHVENQYDTPQYIEWKTVQSRIKVVPEWVPALDKINGYSHLIIMWIMHKNVQKKKSHVPQGMYEEVPKVGIFSCRCPQRPNPIAISLVKLIRVEDDGDMLVVEGLDAINGSPVLDIKPYTPYFDDISIVRPGEEVSSPDWTCRLTY